MKIVTIFLFINLFTLNSCFRKTEKDLLSDQHTPDSSGIEQDQPVNIDSGKIEIEKAFLYDQHTLSDRYPYKDTTRVFQWDKIRERLTLLESIQRIPASWAILQNYKNKNGEAPLVRNYHRNEYKRIADSLGVERYQSIPLYLPDNPILAEFYGRDGSLVKYVKDSTDFIKITTVYLAGEWIVPRKYVKFINDKVVFKKAIFVDRTNQNIATLEKVDSKWLVRSMNPATTGLHNPPYAQETPLGIFVIQERKSKMIYLKDGSRETGGFAPYASRFTNGGYIHGIPVNTPHTVLNEFSPSLGTTPRSHMCVRNATSHAKFIYNWALGETLVFVLD